MPKLKNKPVVLVIMDGLGVAPPSNGNAVTIAKTPNLNKYITSYPVTTLNAASESVGLPWGEVGNSEVGHTNLGAGFIFYQNYPRINKAIIDGSFFTNKAFLAATAHVKKNRSRLHLVGLIGSGAVHSHSDHLFALLELAKQQKVKEVYIHTILDGRDTIFNTGKGFVEELEKKIKEIKSDAQIATVSGRFYAMDRDNHWERIEKSYQAMTSGQSEEYFKDPTEAINSSYAKKVYDEEFVPVVIGKKNKPTAVISDNDAVIFFNFRSDRGRELTKAFILPDFEKFPRQKINNLFFVTMTEYEKALPVEVAYAPSIIRNPLAKVLADNKIRQLHAAETEKYAHVTFFFNGGMEDAFNGEERLVIPSPRVASYDLKPEMSAKELTDAVLKKIDAGNHEFIVINYANPDMVAHTGNLQASIKAVEAVDKMLGRLVDGILAKNGIAILTADHGNAEELVNLQTGELDKEHSTNPVPFIVIGKDFEGKSLAPEGFGNDLSVITPSGVLADVAPSILCLLGIQQPDEMTGTTLI